MVLGIGEGSIDIVLEKTNFSAGDRVKGKVILKLNKPKKAKELRIELWAERKSKSVVIGKGTKTKTTTEILHKYTAALGGEKDYDSGEYEFEIKLPNIEKPEKPEGALGAVADVAKFMGVGPGQMKWQLKASLNLSMGFDITKKIQLNVV